MRKNLFYLTVITILIVVIGYLSIFKNGFSQETSTADIQPFFSTTPEASSQSTSSETNNSSKTYTFKQFHGETVAGGGFTFQYPTSWHNNGQYFSPEPIRYYDITSVDAPVYFDLIDKELFETSDLKYQISEDKRNKPDSTGKIDGKTFKRYDLIDYGSSGGESSGRVVIYLGPEVSFNGHSYYLVFRWEEHPLTLDIPGNDSNIFDKIVSTLKFTQ